MPAILYAILYVVYSIYMDRRGVGNINHSAHLWGAAYGVIFTSIMEPRLPFCRYFFGVFGESGRYSVSLQEFCSARIQSFRPNMSLG